MKLESPFTYTDFVRPACLPDKDFEMETGWTAITGWGATEQGSSQQKNNIQSTLRLSGFTTLKTFFII